MQSGSNLSEITMRGCGSIFVSDGLGNPGDAKPVGDAISELRIDYGPGYRVYYLQLGDKLVLLLIDGDKSSRAMDIARAKQLAKNL